jgi:histidine triad (HIT) family protein
MAIAVKKALGVEGIHIAQLNGAAAGQTVPHCHFHVIPHEKGVVLRMHAAEPVAREELEAVAERIRAQL